MSPYTLTYICQDTDTPHIEIKNISNHMLNNLTLTVKLPSDELVQYTVMRERGSLTFTSPTGFIELGNLSPQESAHFYCTLKTHSPKDVLTELILSHDEILEDQPLLSPNELATNEMLDHEMLDHKILGNEVSDDKLSDEA